MSTRDEIAELKAEVAQLRKELAAVKAAASPEMVLKTDSKERIVFGWAYVARNPSGGQVVDYSGDFVDSPERVAKMESAAYRFMENSRGGDSMHSMTKVATCVENVVFTPEKVAKMGLPADWAPSAWWTGFRVHDDKVWDLCERGEIRGFSIYGSGKRHAVGAAVPLLG